MFGGTGRVVDAYAELFFSALARYVDAQKRVVNLNDQFLHAALACLHPELVEVLRPPEYTYEADPRGVKSDIYWFFMLPYLQKNASMRYDFASDVWRQQEVGKV